MAEDPKISVQGLNEAMDQAQAVTREGAGKDRSKLMELASQAPVIKLVDCMLAEAINRRASDIHIETFERLVRVRYRIDGLCYQIAEPPKNLALALSSRLKVLANLDVAESRLPQDGRILFSVGEKQVDLRVSMLPTVFGESIVLRVLDKGALDKTLGDLGMEESMQSKMEHLIAQPHGLLLVTGPTGAGKTTTLYACLQKLNRPETKLITTEDPVEYDIDRLVQVAVNAKIHLDFATCLRAILRHDPDVIMVGEIRDPETAKVAFQASLTGHIVFSTLHTNDAPGAITRLLDMGLEPFLITSTVSGILAQRLVRKLCESCKAPYDPKPEEMAVLGLEASSVQKSIQKAVGCDTCQGIGYHGRVGLYELLILTDAIRPMILERSSVSEIRGKARAEGMRTLREAGTVKVLEGMTTVEEVLRETQDYG